MILLLGVVSFLRALVFGAAAVAIENAALRQQVAVLHRSVARPRLRQRDRLLWAWLARCWGGWRASLLIVRPATVLAWHRRGFRLYWGWRSRARGKGRPPLDGALRALIQRMARENPTWGRRRIQAELALLGYAVSGLTVARYMGRRPRRPSPTWRAFLAAHLSDLAAVDFFVVPTLTFRLLFAFVILRHDRRELLRVSVTDHPTAAWAAQQIEAAFSAPSAPAYLLRDRDGVYGDVFQQRLAAQGIRQRLIAPQAPWQNPFAERVIGSIRRECLDHVVVLNERHLLRRLRSYQRYYNAARPHQSLGDNSPWPRAVEPPEQGPIVAVPQVGGLHHRYRRAA